MIIAQLLLGFSLAIFFSVAVAVLVWAVRAGQFADSAAGSESIFDPGEPIGKTTDSFPGPAHHDPAQPRHAMKGLGNP